MTKHVTYWFLSICIMVNVSIFFTLNSQKKPKQCTLWFDNGTRLDHIFLADTPRLKQQGLSKKIHIENGMFFTFLPHSKMIFWMKDTYIPLSIGFFSDDNILFQIDNMQPLSTNLHFSQQLGSSALELPAGQFKKLKLQPGVKLIKIHC